MLNKRREAPSARVPAVKETIRLMARIERALPKWPIELVVSGPALDIG